MDVGDWLRSLGLERYEQAFRDNEIDFDLLPNLTGDDLKDLGVALGATRRRHANFWAEQGEQRQAHDLLQPVYAGVTEGSDLPDLKDAKALLGGLR